MELAPRHRDPAPGGVLGSATKRGIDRCAERLRRHEHAASTMIAEVYYTDEGGPWLRARSA